MNGADRTNELGCNNNDGSKSKQRIDHANGGGLSNDCEENNTRENTSVNQSITIDSQRETQNDNVLTKKYTDSISDDTVYSNSSFDSE